MFSTHSHFRLAIFCVFPTQPLALSLRVLYVFLAHKYRIVKWDQIWCCVRVEMRFGDAMQICALCVWDYVGKSWAHAEDLFRFELSDGGMKAMTVSYASRISTLNQLANWCYIVVLTPFANCARNIYIRVVVAAAVNAEIKCTQNVCSCKCEHKWWRWREGGRGRGREERIEINRAWAIGSKIDRCE